MSQSTPLAVRSPRGAKPMMAVGLMAALVSHAGAAPPAAKSPEAKRALPDSHQAAEDYLAAAARQIATAALGDIKTPADWAARRETLRAQFREMMALGPLPPRTDLVATVTGTIQRTHLTVERLHFQSLPGLYVTANVYRPKPRAGEPANIRRPAILYLCGHARNPAGNKAAYQRHGLWFAANGYVCLVMDTNELGELGSGIEHHGTCVGLDKAGRPQRPVKWWWHAAGFTPGGVETWNAIRALDYLTQCDDVDPQRIGVTGRSGGGAMAWALAALDDRVAAVAGVAGLGGLESHVADRLVDRHCDCMYFPNIYGWDFSVVAALAAPRPALLANSDADAIFPWATVAKTAQQAAAVYKTLGIPDKWGLVKTPGRHEDTRELREAVFAFFNRWLRDQPGPVNETDTAPEPIPPEQLRVFAPDGLPTQALNRRIDALWTATPQPPDLPDKATWTAWRDHTRQTLRETVFRAWPQQPADLHIALTPGPKPAYITGNVITAELAFTSEPHIRLRALFVQPTAVPMQVPPGGPRAIVAVLPAGETLEKPRADFVKALNEALWPVLLVETRGQGPGAWRPESDLAVRRRYALVGRTVDGMRVWDIRRALAAFIEKVPAAAEGVTLVGVEDSAALVVYAALYEPTVQGVVLRDPPKSHRQAVPLLGILAHWDFPTAVGLLIDRRVDIVRRDAGPEWFTWAKSLSQRFFEEKFVEVTNVP